MKATVKEVTVATISVEYEDGSVAIVPIIKGQNKTNIAEACNAWNNPNKPFDSLSDVPVAVGDVLEYVEVEETDPDVDYRDARLHHYPRINKQMDAAYWLRQGDDTQQKLVDAEILNVKTKIPKTWSGKQSDIPKISLD
tara:strand:+ start:416 stop:832 length:417 start_codon:yes stop_codon:yes gene_type:complete